MNNSPVPIVYTDYPMPRKLYTVDFGPEYMITIEPGEDNPITIKHGDCALLPSFKEHWIKFLYVRDSESSREFVVFCASPMMIFEKLNKGFGMVLSNQTNTNSTLNHLLKVGESMSNDKDFGRVVFSMMGYVKEFYIEKMQELDLA